MTGNPTFRLNGAEVSLAGADATESLLRWLKRQRLTGTKEGCADGDCGACTVAFVAHDDRGAARYEAVNSCLVPVGAISGREVVTVEALADGDALHPVQQALVDCAGSQCGYCTPGFVMSLFAAYYDRALDDGATEGNLCRCTGYKPIREATARLDAAPPRQDRFRDALDAARPAAARAAVGAFQHPATIGEALALRRENPDAAWICGGTDIGVALSHGLPVAPAFIALDGIDALHALEIFDEAVRIGAAVPLATLEARLAGMFAALDQMLPWFAARQVRNRATFGGNLGTASPIGDLLPILLALDARIELEGPTGARALAADGYFLDYRKTARAPDELVVAVVLPRRGGIQAAYKVAKRQTDDISIVAAAFALELDEARRVTRARLAYGGVAATPRRATRAEAMLVGEPFTPATAARLVPALEDEFAPIDDHRAGAAYRRALAGSLFAKFVAEHAR
ncbi:MAG TPA: FAD binding domain-containing protein [Candidatus Saccharimonadia bacterium]|nr:FAD binding domain-containing protein [Candidatus Saccharimonadia bacterium]